MEFIEIFTQMHWVAWLLLGLGLLCMLIEIIIPDFGFFGTSGIVLLLAGVIVEICMGGMTAFQVIMLILIVLVVYLSCIWLMIRSAKDGKLGKSGLFESRPTISQNYNVTKDSLKELVGKTGVAISELNMAGQAEIDGKIYDVVSEMAFIEKNSHIKVVKIKDNTIIVKKIDEEN